MEFDINALVNAVVAKVDGNHRQKKEYLSSKAFKFEAPNPKDGEDMVTYIVKLLPWTKDGAAGFGKTFSYRLQYRWQGMPEPGQARGKWNYVTSAVNVNEPCPINEWRNEFLQSNTGNTEEIKRVLGPLNRNEVRVTNILVVDDPKHPENNGKVFPVELNKALWDIVDGALHGQLDEHFTEIRGSSVNVAKKIFELGPSGMNLKVKVTLNQGGIPQYGKSEMCFTKADLFGDNGIRPNAEDKVKMLESGCSLKDIVMERINNDIIDPAEYIKDGIRPYGDVKKLFVKSFLSNPKISMHVTAKWMSEDSNVSEQPKVVSKPTPVYENTRIDDEYDMSNASSVPSFADTNDMDEFMAELEAEQGY